MQLGLMKSSLDREVSEFIELVHSEDGTLEKFSEAAFCNARKKLKHTAFIALSNESLDLVYADTDHFDRWKGMRLIATDGSSAEVPNSKEVIEKWGIHKTRNDGKHTCLARVLQVYDVLNHYTMNGQIDSFEVGETELFQRSLKEMTGFKSYDMFLFDRGFASQLLMVQLANLGVNFCFRMKKDWWKVVEDFYNSDETDRIITISVPPKDKKKAIDLNLEKLSVEVRLTKVLLNTGEIEILAHTLLDINAFNQADLKELYNFRWGVETSYNKLKHRVELENFTGKSIEKIKQDFYAKIFILNITAFLVRPIDKILEKRPKRKHFHKVNFTFALSKIKKFVVKVLFLENISEIGNQIKNVLCQCTIPIRNGRSFPRNKQPKHKYRPNYKA
jgi:Transposase DDE domain